MITGPDGTGAGAGTEISCLQVRDHHKVRCFPPPEGERIYLRTFGRGLLRCATKLGTVARQAA